MVKAEEAVLQFDPIKKKDTMTLIRYKLYLFIGQTDVLQDATEVELLDRKFPKTNKFHDVLCIAERSTLLL